MKYADVMKEARTIKLQEIGIEDVRCRRSMSGGMVIEIPGRDSGNIADLLAKKLKERFNNRSEVRINRPTKMAEVIIRDLDDSITPQEVAQAVAQNGECRVEEINTGEIRQRTPYSLGTIWVRCPATAARKIIQKGKIIIEWSSARVTGLPPRSIQYFRCLRTGHVKS